MFEFLTERGMSQEIQLCKEGSQRKNEREDEIKPVFLLFLTGLKP